MRSSWLVLAVLMLIAGTAKAEPIASFTPATVMVPERGATGMPLERLLQRYETRDVDRHRCGMSAVVDAFFYLVFLFGWIGSLAARDTSADRGPKEMVPRLVAEGVARRVLRWYVVWAAMLVVGQIVLYAAGSKGIPIMLTPFAIAALVRLAYARSVERMLDQPDALTRRHGSWLFVQTPTGVGKLRASDADFVQARRAGIPSAALQRGN